MESWQGNVFEAESAAAPRRRLRIEQDPPVPPNSPPNYSSGWHFYITELRDDGTEEMGWDCWDETFERILLYPPSYAPRDIVWRRVSTGEIVDLYALKL